MPDCHQPPLRVPPPNIRFGRFCCGVLDRCWESLGELWVSSGWGWGELWKALGVLDFWVKIVSLGRRFVDVAGTDFLGFGWGGCWHVSLV